MRISDWSSDVCSSDLGDDDNRDQPEAADPAAPADAGAAHPRRTAHASEAAAAAAAVLDVGALTAPTPAHRKSLPVVKPADPCSFGLLAGPCSCLLSGDSPTRRAPPLPPILTPP